MKSKLTKQRSQFHSAILNGLIREKDGVPNFADSSSKISVRIAALVIKKLEGQSGKGTVVAQNAGKRFEEYVLDFVKASFSQLVGHLRPGVWDFARNQNISTYEQYAHLVDIANAVKKDSQLATVLGSDYIIRPDIVMWRQPVTDEMINEYMLIVDSESAGLTPYREINQEMPLMHASISCKWTIRSDRSQNSRTEALNLIRNRKGRVPNIVVVTAEPLPSRIASIALGTGDIDCTYHFALNELIEAVEESKHEEALNLINIMVEGKRLRDISDLPLDLSI